MRKLTKNAVIKKHIKPGVYVRAELKTRLEELYEAYGINENAKATDIAEVYKISHTTMRCIRKNSSSATPRVVAALNVQKYFWM